MIYEHSGLWSSFGEKGLAQVFKERGTEREQNQADKPTIRLAGFYSAPTTTTTNHLPPARSPARPDSNNDKNNSPPPPLPPRTTTTTPPPRIQQQQNKVFVQIPRAAIAAAQGLAIFTTLRGGFQIAGAAGSGLVVARLPDGSWSPPSAFSVTALGAGFVAGLDIHDCVW